MINQQKSANKNKQDNLLHKKMIKKQNGVQTKKIKKNRSQKTRGACKEKRKNKINMREESCFYP